MQKPRMEPFTAFEKLHWLWERFDVVLRKHGDVEYFAPVVLARTGEQIADTITWPATWWLRVSLPGGGRNTYIDTTPEAVIDRAYATGQSFYWDERPDLRF